MKNTQRGQQAEMLTQFICSTGSRETARAMGQLLSSVRSNPYCSHRERNPGFGLGDPTRTQILRWSRSLSPGHETFRSQLIDSNRKKRERETEKEREREGLGANGKVGGSNTFPSSGNLTAAQEKSLSWNMVSKACACSGFTGDTSGTEVRK